MQKRNYHYNLHIAISQQAMSLLRKSAIILAITSWINNSNSQPEKLTNPQTNNSYHGLTRNYGNGPMATAKTKDHLGDNVKKDMILGQNELINILGQISDKGTPNLTESRIKRYIKFAYEPEWRMNMAMLYGNEHDSRPGKPRIVSFEEDHESEGANIRPLFKNRGKKPNKPRKNDKKPNSIPTHFDGVQKLVVNVHPAFHFNTGTKSDTNYNFEESISELKKLLNHAECT